jgi:hypothetical protein
VSGLWRHLAVCFCVSAGACNVAPTSVHGTVSVQGSDALGGSWTRNVDDCQKVDGITLFDHGTAVIAVSSDPVTGDSIALPVPRGGTPVVLFARDCRALRVDTHFNGVVVTNNEVSNDQEMSGSVTADCDVPGGGSVTANASFDNCL